MKLKEHYMSIYDGHEHDEINWHKWEYVTLTNGKRITSCVPKTSSLQEFFNNYMEDMKDLPLHLFRAKWQQEQLQKCIQGLSNTQAVLVMDYAENYQCNFQNEAQNAFFDRNTVTIHPMMLYYIKSVDEERTLVKHAIICITDDDIKDAAGVKVFERKARDILKENNVEISVLHEFSDGCAAQYKGKNSFCDISMATIKTTRNFFETSHGKSVCDGLGSIVKNCAVKAVMSGKVVIPDAKTLYNFCLKKLSHGAKHVSNEQQSYISVWDVQFVKQEEVHREDRGMKTLPGTRKLHAVMNVGRPLKLLVRELSCYCDNCTAGTQPCRQSLYVDGWREVTLHSTTVPTSLTICLVSFV